MKQLLVMFFMVFSVCLYAQKITVPDVIKSSFAKNFRGAANIKWGKENSNYEVDFTVKENKMSALYNKEGILQETEVSISAEQIPEQAKLYFKKYYANLSIKEYAKITKADGLILYEIGTRGKDFLFNSKGEFVKEVKD